MKIRTKITNLGTTLTAAAVASVLVACTSAPVRPAGATEARARLTQLQSDPTLANRAPVAIQAADSAIRVAEQPETDSDLVAYRVYIADRKVDTARALAETRRAEDQRSALRAQGEKARLDARTRQLDVARNQIAVARVEGAEQTLVADRARSDADAANLSVASSDQQAAELRRQIELLQGRVTDRGVVLVLDDGMFSGDGIGLNDGPSSDLNKLVTFLDQYPERTVTIEGYTDNIGSDDDNLALSQDRADSVKSYLIEQGVGAARLTAAGMGDRSPVAGNDSASGRQQNRRVEVIINPQAAVLR